jgi:uncharacterized protein (TIGR03083 family)
VKLGSVPDAAALFATAAETVADLVERLDTDVWDRPGLGAWDVRALVGHTSRSLITVTTYFDQPAPTARVRTADEYYAVIASGEIPGTTDAEAVAERGRQAGAQLGDDPAAAFRALVAPAVAKARAADPDAVVETITGGTRVGAYLPTRTFELVVHGLDIAAATGASVEFAPELLTDALDLAAAIAVRKGQGATVLRALTGRQALPDGFCVV